MRNKTTMVVDTTTLYGAVMALTTAKSPADVHPWGMESAVDLMTILVFWDHVRVCQCRVRSTIKVVT